MSEKKPGYVDGDRVEKGDLYVWLGTIKVMICDKIFWLVREILSEILYINYSPLFTDQKP